MSDEDKPFLHALAVLPTHIVAFTPRLKDLARKYSYASRSLCAGMRNFHTQPTGCVSEGTERLPTDDA